MIICALEVKYRQAMIRSQYPLIFYVGRKTQALFPRPNWYLPPDAKGNIY